MLSVVTATCLLLSGLAHSEPLKDWMRRVSWEQSRSKKLLPMYCYNGHFVDYEDRLLHEELPSADVSRGGVYFFGASTIKWALKPWELPVEVRPLIHNFGCGGCKHSDQADFIRFLVQEEELLKAGPEKTLIVFGTNYRTIRQGRLPGEGPGRYFRELWTRHGAYTIESDGTIRRTHSNPLLKEFILEPSRATGFLRESVNLVYVPFKSTRVQTPKEYNDKWVKLLGSDWNEIMDSELGYLKSALEDLKERNVNVAVMLMPMGSWDSDLPYQAAYFDKMSTICHALGVKIFDYSKLLDDEDFADSDHLNPNGIEKFQQTVMGLCLDHLRSSGLLPSNDAVNGP